MSLQVKHIESLFQEGYSLPDLLPYLEYSDGMFILSDGSLGKVWKLSLLESEGKGEDALIALVDQWENWLNRLPNDRLACQFILRSERNISPLLDKYLLYKEEQGRNEFAQGKAAHLRCGPDGLFTHRSEAFVPKQWSLYVTVRYFPHWGKPGIWKQGLDRDMQQHSADFLRHIALIEGIFQSTGVDIVPLAADDLALWLYRVLNPIRSVNIEMPAFNDQGSIRDQVLYHAPQAQGNGFILDNTHMRLVSLKELPSETTISMFTRELVEGGRSCLLDMQEETMLVINFTVPGANETMGRLNMQKSFAFLHQDNFLGDKSIEAVEKKKELDETIGQMYKGGNKIVHARLHWVIRGIDENNVESACNKLISALGRLGCGGLKEEMIGASLFLTCLPLNFDPYYEKFIRRVRRLASGNAADMLPVLGPFRGTKTPAQMYCNRRGEIVYLDFFDTNTNPHGVVIGASGAGKSFFINDFILQNDRLGAHFFVLDKGNSYEKLSRILDGQYVTFDLNLPVTINPFANPPTPENLSFLLSMLSQMASGGDERDRLNREEEGLLHRAVTRAYENKKDGLEVTLSDVAAVLNENDFNAHFGINSLMGPTLALRLTPFTAKGPYGKFFDGQGQFKIERRFTVFELANLSSYPDLQVTVLLNLMFFITNFVSLERMRSKRKYLLIDEAWSLLKVKNSADFITNAFKTFRKYRCSVVAITQEMADLAREESGLAIVANAANKVFLKQEASLIDMLKEKFSFSDGIIKSLKSIETVKCKFSEALVITDSACGIIRLVPDPFLYWVANSEPRNNEYLYEKEKACGNDLIEAVKVCAKEHPYGI